MVDRLGWCLPLILQKLLLEVGDRLCHLLKLGILCLNGMLKVDDPVGTDIHLLVSDVVPPMLSLTKSTVSDMQLTVLL
jgi:hypothetical protein